MSGLVGLCSVRASPGRLWRYSLYARIVRITIGDGFVKSTFRVDILSTDCLPTDEHHRHFFNLPRKSLVGTSSTEATQQQRLA